MKVIYLTLSAQHFDLAALPHLYGMQSGQVKYPCVGCLYLGTMTKAEKQEGLSIFNTFRDRDNLVWQKCWEEVMQHDDNVVPQPVKNYSVERMPVIDFFSDSILGTCVALSA